MLAIGKINRAALVGVCALLLSWAACAGDYSYPNYDDHTTVDMVDAIDHAFPQELTGLDQTRKYILPNDGDGVAIVNLIDKGSEITYPAPVEHPELFTPATSGDDEDSEALLDAIDGESGAEPVPSGGK